MNEKNPKTPKEIHANNFPVVSVGASAGALNAFKKLMNAIPENTNAVGDEKVGLTDSLLSGSEKLQSLNEELETRKEELQSNNEELLTLNQELSDPNDQLNQLKIFAETTISTLHGPLLVLDKDFIITSANKAFYKVFKISEEETIGKIIFELQNGGWNIPGLKKELIKIKNKVESSIETEITFAFPEIDTRTICFNIQPIKLKNGEKLILLALDDITERKKLNSALKRQLLERKQDEVNLRLILESLPQTTITLTPEGKVTFLNKHFLEYSGLSFEEAVTGNGWKYVIHPTEVKNLIDASAHSLKTGQDFAMELQLKRSDGQYRWHLCRGTAIRDKENKIIQWVGAANDINFQKLKEQQKDEFISIASHEMKTPLTTASAYLQLLEQTIDPEDKELMLLATKGYKAIERLNELVKELLDVSKIQNGRLEYNFKTFDINEIIDDTIETFRHTSSKYTISKSGLVKKKVNGDKERLQQVLINLLSNAIKYSPANKKININITNSGDTFTVEVKDRGIGISASGIGKIFERYYREKENEDRIQGLGIGLYISAEIIKRHGGQIHVESELGKGSSFYFTLPFVVNKS